MKRTNWSRHYRALSRQHRQQWESLRIREAQERRALYKASLRAYAGLADEAGRAIRLRDYVGAILQLNQTQEDRRELLGRQQGQEQADLDQQSLR